jgi:hypothetical protein
LREVAFVATLFVRHTVADFDTWKKVYDEADEMRRSMGVTSHGVYQLDGNPNDVTVYHEFDSMDAAKSFVESPRLREALQQAGVQGHPDIWITQMKK